MADTHIGVSIHSTLDARWQSDADLFPKIGAELGARVTVEIANGVSLVQNDQCQKMMQQGAQAILVVAQDAVKAGRIVEMGKEKKVPIIAYDRMIRDCDLPLFVGMDVIQIGKLQARYAAEHAPQGDYIIIDGDEGDNNSHLIRQGRQTTLEGSVRRGQIKIAYEGWCDGWRASRAKQMTLEGLKQAPKPAAILCAADILAEGAIQALNEARPERPPIITSQNADLGGVLRILRGSQSMSIFKPLIDEVKLGLETAIALTKGQRISTSTSLSNGKVQVPCVLVPGMIVVEKSNVISVVTGPKGNMTLQQICSKLPKPYWPPEAAAAGLR